jgi:hypothetical protein
VVRRSGETPNGTARMPRHLRATLRAFPQRLAARAVMRGAPQARWRGGRRCGQPWWHPEALPPIRPEWTTRQASGRSPKHAQHRCLVVGLRRLRQEVEIALDEPRYGSATGRRVALRAANHLLVHAERQLRHIRMNIMPFIRIDLARSTAVAVGQRPRERRVFAPRARVEPLSGSGSPSGRRGRKGSVSARLTSHNRSNVRPSRRDQTLNRITKL